MNYFAPRLFLFSPRRATNDDQGPWTISKAILSTLCPTAVLVGALKKKNPVRKRGVKETSCTFGIALLKLSFKGEVEIFLCYDLFVSWGFALRSKWTLSP